MKRNIIFCLLSTIFLHSERNNIVLKNLVLNVFLDHSLTFWLTTLIILWLVGFCIIGFLFSFGVGYRKPAKEREYYWLSQKQQFKTKDEAYLSSIKKMSSYRKLNPKIFIKEIVESN